MSISIPWILTTLSCNRMESKAELRKYFRVKRASLSDEERKKLSFLIEQQILSYLDLRPKLKHMHIFLPIKKLKEVDTFPLIQKLLDRGLDLYTSAVDFQTQEMKTLKIRVPLETVEDEFGIPVPVHQEITEIKCIQMVLIPLLAYDLDGNRLGYGMGFYDRFLEALPRKVVKAGVSFFSPEEQIPSESHDIKLDICFTAKEIHQF